MADKAKTKIVAATGSSVGGKVVRAHMIEDAMAVAVMECAKEGITDPEEILKRKLAARAKVVGK